MQRRIRIHFSTTGTLEENRMFGATRRIPTGCSTVHNDEIWRAHIHLELQTNLKWKGIWGFLAPNKVEKKTSPPQEKTGPTNHIQALDLATPSKKYPQTTSGEIGLHRRGSIGQLERFGPRTRGLTSLHKQFNWPCESL